MARQYKQWRPSEIKNVISICNQENDYESAANAYNISVGSVEAIYRKYTGKRVVSKKSLELRQHNEKMTIELFEDIQNQRETGIGWQQIADHYKVSRGCIIARYRSMSKKFSVNKINRQVSLNESDYLDILQLKESGLSWKAIADELGLKVSTASQRFTRLKQRFG